MTNFENSGSDTSLHVEKVTEEIYICHNCGSKQNSPGKCMSCASSATFKNRSSEAGDGMISIKCWNCGENHSLSFNTAQEAKCRNCGKSLK